LVGLPLDDGLESEVIMPIVNDVTSDRRRHLVAGAEEYFRGLAQKDMSRVPWHPDIVFRGPLTPEAPRPLRGEAAVRAWFEGLYPALAAVEVLEHYVDENQRSIVTRANVHLTQPPAVLRVLDRFEVDEAGMIVEQENHFDPRPALEALPGLMSAQERDLLLDLLVSSQQRLIAATVGLTTEQWMFDPGPGRWSIAQCAEHLALSEDALRGVVRGQVLESPATADAAAAARGRDGIVVGAMRDRSNKIKTFDFLEPRTISSSPAVFVTDFLQKRAATLNYVRETNDCLHHHFAPLGPLGNLDGYQWLLLLASHTERHVAQMDEVKAQPGYPS
jgi:DinB family protein/SnoaL-like protein